MSVKEKMADINIPMGLRNAGGDYVGLAPTLCLLACLVGFGCNLGYCGY